MIPQLNPLLLTDVYNLSHQILKENTDNCTNSEPGEGVESPQFSSIQSLQKFRFPIA